MQLFLMRHGEASFDAACDKERVLTETGRYQSRTMVQCLRMDNRPFDLVLVSPYIRAQQTWQEVRELLGEPRHCIELNNLTPDASPRIAADVILAYAEQYKADKVLVISHMPLLGYLIGELVAGEEPPLFATSAVALLDKHGERLSYQSMTMPSMMTASSPV
ncbi:phosphohistidine phosphatase SixA [Shewanella sp. NIFS-20-20]|uniref:phosphohistidine phosphatase SixA n=1 Tax=Shewanella sp. NIFS-20-20 TaxID=2853806 RepID=UPI001C44EC10|nr:phosphohistidine phosphatase SixA [Shewanella sp. NIFS-20-20]MBV7315013.1 phosphohistidine phosphatase SixA [Shewanella sp. NIFS-20-20]